MEAREGALPARNHEWGALSGESWMGDVTNLDRANHQTFATIDVDLNLESERVTQRNIPIMAYMPRPSGEGIKPHSLPWILCQKVSLAISYQDQTSDTRLRHTSSLP